MATSGKFIISLDFELMWGVRDVVTTKQYGDNIKGVHKVIPKLLSIFDTYGIHATFATVGLLMFRSKSEMLQALPAQLPGYTDSHLSPFGNYMEENVGENEQADSLHFGYSLVQLIHDNKNQEIASHTFSHYYCLEDGQNLDEFKADLHAAASVAKQHGIDFKSIIFPRNQFNESYLKECFNAGITSYRNNESSWIYTARNGKSETHTRRAMRLLDSYINLTGHHAFSLEKPEAGNPLNIPSSRFLRPYNHNMRMFEKLRLRRILDSMTFAARHKRVYHLWWHPHNFGVNQDKNFRFLESILQHYRYLNNKYAFESCCMATLANEYLNGSK